MKKFVSIVLLIVAVLTLACSCKSKANLKNITIACSSVPHAEIISEIKDQMKEMGFNLIIKEYKDYDSQNEALIKGEVDANYFEHKPYLEDYNKKNGSNIVPIVAVHYEPLGLYAGNKMSLKLSAGDKIAIPSDYADNLRALYLLQEAKFITLDDNKITSNPYSVEIVEMKAEEIPKSLSKVALVCMNGNYAIEAGFNINDALFVESENEDTIKTYANLICVNEENENADFVEPLKQCMKSEKIKEFIGKTYNGSVIYVD